jgi:hypothetical protein
MTTYMAMRAGIRRTRRTYLIGVDGPIVAAPVLPVSPDPERNGRARGLALLRPALEECRKTLPSSASSGAFLLHLTIPTHPHLDALARAVPEYSNMMEVFSEGWRGFADACAVAARSAGFSIVGSPAPVIGDSAGAAGTMAFAERALGETDPGAVRGVLLVSVTTLCERVLLEGYDGIGLGRSRRSPDGFTPSEAAVVVAMVRESEGKGIARSRASLLVERGTDETAGAGAHDLATCIGRCPRRADARAETLREHFTDETGREDLVIERANASLTSLGARGMSPRVVQPLFTTGMPGAAAGSLVLALAALAAREERESVLVTLAPSSRLRGAVVVDPFS